MTYEQAMQKLNDDYVVLQQAQSDLKTATHLNAIGELDKSIELFAQIRAKMRKQFMNA